MKEKKYVFLSGFLTILVSLGIFGFVIAEDNGVNTIPDRKIVVFKSGLSDIERSSVISRAQGVKIRNMENRDMMVAHLDAQGEKALENDPNVAFIEDDVVVEAVDNKKLAQSKAASVQPAEVLPWGINRIDAEQVWPSGDMGTGIDVGIIDTGISTAHPDLAVKGGVSEVRYTSSYNDDNGHGSHVSGIVGALDNSIGVIGGAPEANLYAIKVLDRNGSGYLSDVINGIDWATSTSTLPVHHIKVINMSLGCDCPSKALHDAVIRAYNAGVVIVAAAGNSGGAVIYPASYPEVIAVGATDSSDTAPYWSSRGPELDLVAPGVSIYSTYKGNKYATLSGTSMASPHVAGTAALLMKTPVNAAYDMNNNGAWDPSEVLQRLEDTAIPLGSSDVYGYGLVNALKAVTF